MAVGIVLSYMYCGKMVDAVAQKTVEQMEKDILANLPEGTNIEEVKTTLADLRTKVDRLIVDKKLEFTELAPMMSEFGKVMDDKKITPEELDKLMTEVKSYLQKE